MSKNVTGTIREKKGLYYAVINYYGENEERKQKWFPTKLPVRGNKKKAEAILKQVLCEFEIPISKGEKVNLCVNQKIQIENTGDAAVVNVKTKYACDSFSRFKTYLCVASIEQGQARRNNSERYSSMAWT